MAWALPLGPSRTHFLFCSGMCMGFLFFFYTRLHSSRRRTWLFLMFFQQIGGFSFLALLAVSWTDSSFFLHFVPIRPAGPSHPSFTRGSGKISLTPPPRKSSLELPSFCCKFVLSLFIILEFSPLFCFSVGETKDRNLLFRADVQKRSSPTPHQGPSPARA